MIPLVFIFYLLPLVSAYNYCNNDTDVCKQEGKVHFVCRLNEELPPLNETSTFVKKIPDTYQFRSLLIKYHNEYRNQLAGGELLTSDQKVFKAASRMRELIWDEELAYIAGIHASTVSYKHTICRSVLRFPRVGENLGIVFASAHRRTIREILMLTLREMFLEYEKVPDPDDLMSKFDITKHNNYGHFSVIINDRVSRLGCAMAVGTNCDRHDPSGYCHFLTCFYDFINMQDSFTYIDGAATSRCSDWASTPSPTYGNLCTNNGKIYPVDHGTEGSEKRNALRF